MASNLEILVRALDVVKYDHPEPTIPILMRDQLRSVKFT